jgi:hypothetical protein
MAPCTMTVFTALSVIVMPNRTFRLASMRAAQLTAPN